MNKILRLKKRILRATLSAFMCVVLIGCIKDALPIIESQQGDGTEFRLNIPTNTQVVTRANTAASVDELTIKLGYCLIYANNDASGTPKMTYLFDVAKDISNNGTANPIISVPKKNVIESTDIVVFIFNTEFSAVSDFGDRLIDVQYSQISAKFPLTGKSGFEVTTGGGIPMYGELTGFASSGGSVPTINIYRSVAKVQVKLKLPMGGNATDVGSFTTANVKYEIFNLAINGNVNTGVGFDDTTTEALNSNDQNEAPKTSIDGLAVDKETASSVNDNYTGASYIYEYHYSDNIIGATTSTPTVVSTPNKDRLAIILHNTANSKYYRLDLSNLGPEYIDVIRNHHYQIVINQVNSEGYATMDEALNGGPSNIKYEIIDNTGTTTISNGNYAISVGEEFFANGIVANQPGNPITIADNVRYITPVGVALPSGLVNSITAIDATTKDPIGSAILTVSPTTLTNVATPLTLTFVDGTYVGEIAFKVILGSLSYEGAPITVESDAMNEIGINVGTVQSPRWITVVDRNADKNGINGAAAGNSAADYGYFYQWSNEDNDPTNVEKSYDACYNFGDGNGTWRQPTYDEYNAIAPPEGASDNALRKLKFDAVEGAWKLFDERAGKEGEFVYFPMAGYSSGSGPNTGVDNTDGYYWASTVSTQATDADVLQFNSGGVTSLPHFPFSRGFSVRCVKDMVDPNMNIGSIGIDMGTYWIKVGDRNADKNGPYYAAPGNSAIDYGYYYEYIATPDENGAYSACFNFAEGNGAWRVPSKTECEVIMSKFQYDANSYTILYDERAGEEDTFVYFPYAGYRQAGAGIIADTGLDYTQSYYWTSTTNNGADRHETMSFRENTTGITWLYTYWGLPIRCVQNIP